MAKKVFRIKSFAPRVNDMWYNLDEYVVHAPGPNAFKNRLDDHCPMEDKPYDHTKNYN